MLVDCASELVRKINGVCLAQPSVQVFEMVFSKLFFCAGGLAVIVVILYFNYEDDVVNPFFLKITQLADRTRISRGIHQQIVTYGDFNEKIRVE